MKFSSIIKSAAVGAGLCILAVGMALAQPAPGGGGGGHHQARMECRDKIDSKLRGPERREAMQKCMQEKGVAGQGRGADGQGKAKDRADRRAERHAMHEKHKEVRKACREELKNQRFTEDERKNAMQECAAKKDPQFGRMLGCRKEAEDKKLERGTKDFREFMRSCNTRT